MSNGDTGGPFESWGESDKSWCTSNSKAHNPAPKSTRPKKPMSKEQITRAMWMLRLKKKWLYGDLVDDTTIAKIFTKPEDFTKSFRPPTNNFGLPPLCSKQAVGQALKRYQDHLDSTKESTKR